MRYSDANATGGSTTTGYVAEQLEKRYGVMAAFVKSRRDKIAGMLADSMANAIADLANGRPANTAAPTFEGEQKIEAEFRRFIYADEMQKAASLQGIVLSQAAQRGVSSRKKKATGKPRVTFVDSGLFVSSFRAWVEK